MPPSYHRQVLLFHGIFEMASPIPFVAGQLITVGIDGPDKYDGHSVYGFTYEVETSLAKGQRQGYHWQMEVEVHTIPGYKVDWEYARPFITPPIGTVFVQPHGFGEDKFELLTPSSPERWGMIRVDLGRKANIFQPTLRGYRLSPPVNRLPPRSVYPQNARHGLLVPARTLLQMAQCTIVAAPQPRCLEPPPRLVQTFNFDMTHWRNVSIRGNQGVKRKFVEIEADNGEEETRTRRRTD